MAPARPPAVLLSAEERARLEEAARSELGRERRQGDGTVVRVYRGEEAALLERIAGARRSRGRYRIQPAGAEEGQVLFELLAAAGIDAGAVEQARGGRRRAS
jgi:hypothetical protein